MQKQYVSYQIELEFGDFMNDKSASIKIVKENNEEIYVKRGKRGDSPIFLLTEALNKLCHTTNARIVSIVKIPEADRGSLSVLWVVVEKLKNENQD